MKFASIIDRIRQGQKLPEEIHGSIIASLYSDFVSMTVGGGSALAATLVCYVVTRHPAFLVLACAFLMILILRIAGYRRFHRAQADKNDDVTTATWEMRYTVAAATFTALLGLSCYAAFALSDSRFLYLLTVSIAMSNLVGIVGRNFGSRLLVQLQLFTVAAPMCAGFLFHGGWEHSVLGLFFLPFFVSARSISERLRKMLIGAQISARDNRVLATQLDNALNNMSYGLIMFDRKMRLTVANARSQELLAVPADIAFQGRELHEIVAECSDKTRSCGEKIKIFADTLCSPDANRGGKRIIEIGRAEYLEINFQQHGSGDLVAVIEDVSERLKAEAKIHHMARFDELTGLPNRYHFQEQAAQILEQCTLETPTALMFLDLDNFKQVNDAHGHQIGDKLLCMVADRLSECLGTRAIMGRFGGDEFVVMAKNIHTRKGIDKLAREMIERIAEPFKHNGHILNIGLSIGVAIANERMHTMERLQKQSDLALFRAKEAGRGVVVFFEPAFDWQLNKRIKLESDLRSAVEKGEFTIHYQPLINISKNQIGTCEALVRWQHPTRGLVSPGEFIPVAEEMGLISKIGEWTLYEACREASTWPGNIRVAVNLSSIQFRNSNVVQSIKDALARSNLDAGRLEIEVTETAILDDMNQANMILSELSDIGVRISLDDFGTGYSSLSYLHNLPLHKVKIDRSFVSDIGTNERSMTLLIGITSLAAALGLKIVIEGIETEDQLALITNNVTVDELQGFYFSRPIPSDQIVPVLHHAGMGVDHADTRHNVAAA